ncbi:MAG: hypothetical protein WCQ57_02870 [Verrucomicrobiota bacterium]
MNNTPTENQETPTNPEADSPTTGISVFHALPILTDAGNGWLNAPVHIVPGVGTAIELAVAISGAFNLTTIEGLSAVVGALSLAVGPGVHVRHPFGGRVPLSMQLWAVADANPNFDRALRYLCQGVVESYASEFGRGILEDDKNLIAQQVNLEKEFQLGAAAEKTGESTRPRWVTKEPEELKQEQEQEQKQQALLLKHLRIRRKRGAFPFGNIVSTKVIEELIAEERDFCFGSFSPDGGALRYLLEASPAERTRVLGFLNSGFQGELLTQRLRLPIFPIASTVWLCAPELIDAAVTKEIHVAMPGALVAPADPPAQEGKTTPMPKEACEKWKYLITGILQTLRLPFHRRYTETAQGHAYSLDDEAVETLAETLDWGTRFTAGPGHPRTVLARSPEHILKIAGLLTLEPIPPDVIGRSAVLLATEVFRWLALGTLDAVSKRQEAVLAEEIEMMTDKLRLRGPLSLRDIVRACHRMTYARSNQILLAAIQAGKVEKDHDLYRAVEK